MAFALLAGTLIWSQPARRHALAESEVFQQWCRFTFCQDSGFVTRAQSTFFQRLLAQRDSTIFVPEYNRLLLTDSRYDESNWARFDTFSRDSFGGKFYKGNAANGVQQWVICLPVTSTMDDDPYVFEIKNEKGKFKVASWDVFPHGNYACCWNEPMDGFYKIGRWFFVNSCGTGSGFCSSAAHLLFFPLSIPNDTLNRPTVIPQYYFQGYPDEEYLKSTCRVHGDTIFADYFFSRDSVIDLEDHEKHIRLEEARFTALFKIDTARRCIQLLNRTDVLRHPGVWMIESENY